MAQRSALRALRFICAQERASADTPPRASRRRGLGATAPRPPCGNNDPIPAYREANDPAIEGWSRLEWPAPPCLAWSDSRYRFVIAVAGRIEGRNTISWEGAAGTWFWSDPTNHVLFVGMIQNFEYAGPKGYDGSGLVRPLVYQALVAP